MVQHELVNIFGLKNTRVHIFPYGKKNVNDRRAHKRLRRLGCVIICAGLKVAGKTKNSGKKFSKEALFFLLTKN
jgi:hypothetical protein